MLSAFNLNQVASWLKSFPRSSQRLEIISFHFYSSKGTISTQAIFNLLIIVWTPLSPFPQSSMGFWKQNGLRLTRSLRRWCINLIKPWFRNDGDSNLGLMWSCVSDEGSVEWPRRPLGPEGTEIPIRSKGRLLQALHIFRYRSYSPSTTSKSSP